MTKNYITPQTQVQIIGVSQLMTGSTTIPTIPLGPEIGGDPGNPMMA